MKTSPVSFRMRTKLHFHFSPFLHPAFIRVSVHAWECIWRLQVDDRNHSWWEYTCGRAYGDFRRLSGVILGHCSTLFAGAQCQSDLEVDNTASLLDVLL